MMTRTCVGLTVALLVVVAPLGRASGQAESEAEADAAGTVASPYAFFDRVGDTEGLQDITAVRVRNASDRVVLRFWARNWNHDPARYRIDLRANGPGEDYEVVVYGGSYPDFMRVLNLHTLRDTCTSANVSDQGSDDVVHTVSAWFQPSCIGGWHSFRTFLSFPSHNPFQPIPGDRSPDSGWTPWIRRSGR